MMDLASEMVSQPLSTTQRSFLRALGRAPSTRASMKSPSDGRSTCSGLELGLGLGLGLRLAREDGGERTRAEHQRHTELEHPLRPG